MDYKFVLYTTHCPKCTVLQKKLQGKGINFDIVEDLQIIKSKGFKSMPMLQINEQKLDFYNANKFINNYKG